MGRIAKFGWVLIVLARCYLQTFSSVINDCDETFNYWEPLNLLVRGFGKQTWEYSSEFSIRSWAFLLLFQSPIEALKPFIQNDGDYTWCFYLVRGCLVISSAILELLVRDEIADTMSSSIANLWMFLQVFNAGWFHASVELLPSSVAAIAYLASLKYALRYLSKDCHSSFLKSVSFNLLAGVLGWPFVMILSVPLCLHYVSTNKIMNSIRTGFDCIAIFSVIGILVVAIDSFFYGKFAPVAWNIFAYNVLNADEDAGPDIFGVEPWYYYLLNLSLNFPLPVLIACFFGFLNLRIWPLAMSLVIWLSIFFGQPHKEERFLYPVYALVTFLGAVGLHQTLTVLFGRKGAMKKIVKVIVLTVIVIQSVSRIIASTSNYEASLRIYDYIQQSSLQSAQENNEKTINVCVGREWYHFPNSFFLPDNHRLRFVSSRFDGLLPGDFLESKDFFKSIRTIPEGMNNRNLFDEGKLWPVDQCDYYIDSTLPADSIKDSFNPNDMGDDWKKVKCLPFIDVENSKILGRTFYVPEIINEYMIKFLEPHWSKFYQLNYVQYCLFCKSRNEPQM